VTDYQAGQGGSPVQGAAGTNGSTGNTGLEHCAKPIGAMAVVEPQDVVLQSLSRYSLASPTSLIRMMIQQSNYFLVVERGVGMQDMKQERALASSGDLRSGSNIGGGLSGLLPGTGGAVLGAVAGGLKLKEAQTSMLAADSRSAVQVASAEGSTRKADLQLGGMLTGSSAGASAGGCGHSNEGKIIAAAFMDNYNKIVHVVNGDPSLQRNVGSLRREARTVTTAGAVFNEGDVVVPKIASVKVLATADDNAKVNGTLGQGEQLVVIGAEQNGYIQVQGSSTSGWVRRRS